MFLSNLLIMLLIIIVQILNLYSLTKTLHNKDKFLYLRLVDNSFVRKTTLPYRIKLILITRISLLITIILTPLIVYFNKSTILLIVIYLVLFLLPLLLLQFTISKSTKELISLNIVENNQDIDNVKFGLFYYDESGDAKYEYDYHRYLINIKNNMSKIFILLVFSLNILILAIPVILVDNKVSTPLITSKITTTQLDLKYESIQKTIILDNVTSITKLEKAPDFSKEKIKYQTDDFLITQFINKAKTNVFVFLDIKAVTFLEIKTSDSIIYWSASDQTISNQYYNQIKDLLDTKRQKTN